LKSRKSTAKQAHLREVYRIMRNPDIWAKKDRSQTDFMAKMPYQKVRGAVLSPP
jgi:hypothetical protein